MVQDQDAPYLSIVGHVLAASSVDREENIRMVALIIFDEYREW